MRRWLGAVVAVAAAAALAGAVARAGCQGDGPEVAVRAFIDAARAADKNSMWQLLGPATRARLAEAALRATDTAGGVRRYGPLDVLEVGMSDGSETRPEVIVREQGGDSAMVDVLRPDGRDAVRAVRIDGKWLVELDLKP